MRFSRNGDFGQSLSLDRSRYDNRSNQWRRRTAARRSRTTRWAGVPLRLVLVTVAAVSAPVTQLVTHNSGPLPDGIRSQTSRS